MAKKITTLFSGVGTPELVLKALEIDFDTLFACEIDKWARATYLANNTAPKTFYEDITKLKATKYENEIDLLVGGSPCQSFSIAGDRGGFEDTRGTLFFEYARVLKETKPKVFVFENVKGLVNHDKGRTFETVKNTFEDLGYKIFYQVLNTKDYGIPQNRERIFVIGFLDHNTEFEFAEKQPLNLCLEDMLEEIVDKKYFLKDEQVERRLKSSYNSFKNSIYDEKGCVGCLCARDYKDPKVVKGEIRVKEAVKKGYSIASIGDSINLAVPNSKTRRGRVGKKVAQTLDTSCNQAVVLPSYIFRKLTPRECFNLQGFSKDFKFPMWGKKFKMMSDSQLYKQVGNAMSQNVLEMIIKQIIKCGGL